MYRFSIIAVGKMKNRALAGLSQDFLKRLNRSGHCDLVELRDGDVASESQRILEVLEKRSDAKVHVLAEEGRTLCSRTFARELGELQGRPAVFVVGGAYGLSDDVKARADCLLSLSPMTFTHEMARMLLSEQLYRAVAIQNGAKYHHG